MKQLAVTIFMKAEPQGSSRAFVRGGKAVITSDNKKLRPFRSELTRMALAEMGENQRPMFGKGTAVSVIVYFDFRRPPSVPKKRAFPVVKPDIDKTVRAVLDSLTGVAFHDDAQVTFITAMKRYAEVDAVKVYVQEVI